ncbi:hypothetical protein [Arthrobacter sp. R1-13]
MTREDTRSVIAAGRRHSVGVTADGLVLTAGISEAGSAGSTGGAASSQ